MIRRVLSIPTALMAVVVVATAGIFILRSVASGEGPGQNVPVQSVEDGAKAIRQAADAMGFAPKEPSLFATSANKLVLVDTGQEQLRLIELVYRSEGKIAIKGSEDYSMLEFFQLPARLESPNGEKTNIVAPGAEIYRDVVDVDEAGKPIKVTYTVLYADRTYVMDFTGEQPTDEGLVKMLASMAIRK